MVGWAEGKARQDGAMGEAKASTQNQAWRWAAGRMGRGARGEAKASTRNQAWRCADGEAKPLYGAKTSRRGDRRDLSGFIER